MLILVVSIKIQIFFSSKITATASSDEQKKYDNEYQEFLKQLELEKEK